MELVILILSIVLIFLSPVIAGGFLAARLSKRDPRRHPSGPTRP
jgi:uncharacterized protein YneF (UPF0154 family)